jgi:hypothetical protein
MVDDQDVASGGAEAPDDGDQDTITLSTGVVLRLRRPSPMVVATAMRKVAKDEPKPPMVHNENKGRDEPNPNDPDYLAAHRAWTAEAGIRSLGSLLPTGTILEEKPDGIVGPDDEDYADLMASMGIDPAAGKYTRYVQWVLHVACGKDDIAPLGIALLRRAGVSEEDVREAEETFPGHEVGAADKTASPDGGD